jgi:hypothetical protein
MYGYFTFEVQAKNSPNRNLVIFCATSDPRPEDVIAVIRKHGESALAPDRIILLGMESEQEAITRIATGAELAEYLPDHTRHVAPPTIQVILIPRNGLASDQVISGMPWRELANAGLGSIFKARQALLIAPATHHFAKPSTRHCDRFIRAANALVDGAEITFIAAMCLRFVPSTIRHFYCDTGGISVVAFAIDSLRRRFDHDASAATVNTFESYGGLKTFVFRECESSMVLVSASTSGGLEKDICDRQPRFRPDQIVTLFSIGPHRHDSPIILDLEEDPVLRASLGDFTSHEHAICPLCDSGSLAVPMMGDQFIPVRSETGTVMLTRNDAPKWLPQFLTMMCCQESLRTFYRSPNTDHATNNVFVDLERQLANWNPRHRFCRRIRRLVLQTVPAALRRIIHLDDPASKLLADGIVKLLNGLDKKTSHIQLVSAKELDQQKPKHGGASLVVAAAVASGQSLLAVSQALRSLQTNGAITYLVALTRMSTVADLEKLEADLRMGEHPTDFGFSVVERIHLPLVGRKAGCAWDDELELLQDWSNVSTGAIRTALENRILILRTARGDAGRGLANHLFWPSKESRELTLRHGFVFFQRSTIAGLPSQGDVYFAIAAVLHHLRFGNGPKSTLRQSEYERRVLSPLCFDRFNDGVIQAALLRAAIRPELDYSASVDESQRMGRVLRSVFGAASTEKGEASREFLLALALGRLRLVRDDIKLLHDEFAHAEQEPISKLMWQEIQSRHLA